MKNPNCKCVFTAGNLEICEACSNTSIFSQSVEVSRVSMQDNGDFAPARQTVQGNIIVDDMMTMVIFDQPDIKTVKDVIRFGIQQQVATFGREAVNEAIRENKFTSMSLEEQVQYHVAALKKMIGHGKTDDLLFTILLGDKAVETEQKAG